MAVVLLAGMCHYDDASRVVWRNGHFEVDGSASEITFIKHKNMLYRKWSKVLVASSLNVVVCLVRLLLKVLELVNTSHDLHGFFGFDRQMVAKSLGMSMPGPAQIA